ncbi:formate dehydrogenase subunit gamma [Maritimibacter sp. DP1N21-5]|uniref:formate dehydrogenase subunit gamma n=1 Tax=Maritimibacter sp. DP1N21-5 TaxID=2836867 RepID=UPI001C481797|nr:formate dehydrogenase subunit gamma [Maritimibacter sp. DP1N21-5]MBV7410468.1 formate dehydrogenase subunit gamma [Maritimibacter sp. DP1N21-5]
MPAHLPAQAPAPAPDAGQIDAVIARYTHLEGPLLPILHGMQEDFGFVPQGAIDPIAKALNISRAEVHGVISFYHDFRDAPAGRHVVKICRAEACQAAGGRDVEAAALAKLGTVWHGTTANGSVTIEPVYCLGLCASGPAAMLDDRLHAQLDPGKIESLLGEVM